MTAEAERIDRFIIASVVLHAAVFSFVLIAPNFFPALGPTWGSDKGGDGGIKVTIAGNISGVPLPQPEVVSEEAPANDNPGLYKEEEPPAPPPPPTKAAEPIPEPTAPVKTPPPKPKPPAPPAKKSAPPTEPPPDNAVATGQGRPDLSYGQFSTGAGSAGIGFGVAAFGDRYSTYVNAITRAISNNWLKSMVDSRITKAPRVYVSFDISRDGKIGGFAIQQSSGIPSLDRSAERAVRASELPPLPTDYRGSSVHVTFYFEYSK